MVDYTGQENSPVPTYQGIEVLATEKFQVFYLLGSYAEKLRHVHKNPKCLPLTA